MTLTLVAATPPTVTPVASVKSAPVIVMTVNPSAAPFPGLTALTVGASAVTVKPNVAVAVAAFASVTVTVYVAAELIAVGVPVIAPVAEAIVTPLGSDGETEKTSGPAPSEPVTGIKEVAATLRVSVVEGIACAADTAAFTAMVKVAVIVAPLASTTVTV